MSARRESTGPRGAERDVPADGRRVVRAAGVDVERVHAALGAGAFWIDTEGGRFSILGVPSWTRSFDADALAELRAALGPRRPPLVDVPFRFHGGLVGYLRYEGDAFFGWLDRFAVVETASGEAWLVGEAPWVAAIEAELARVVVPPLRLHDAGLADHRAARDDTRYRADIARSLEHIAAGDSYEICLTNRIEIDARPDPTLLFRTLRRTNPAPYAALVPGPEGVIVSSSPELFLAIGANGDVATKPIKGTAPRSADPVEDAALADALATSEKTRSENLMIVDLLRNDLGVVCAVGSVRVPALMVVESYATVHQLVSRIVGTLRPGHDAFDCVRAAFPGGSMTGAPKRKTMEILRTLEGAPRGVYAGALGWFSVDGAAELAIVIRTAVVGEATTAIGVGGAIIALSDPESELAETKLKAEPLLRAIASVLRDATSTANEQRPAGGASLRQI